VSSSAAVETWAVIVAAGDGRRLGAERPKAFVGLGGRPLLAYSIELFEDHPAVDRMVLVVPEDWQEPATLLADELVAGKVADAVAGGATRTASVAAGLERVPEAVSVVIVHDAARPLARPALIDRVLGGLIDADGSVPGVAVTDTVKRVSGERVVETLDRSQLVAVQTPQAFRAEALRQAYAQPERPADVTDCAGLLERIGLPVAVVEGDPGNVKVTVPADLERAERALVS
jgi:2-C-methyl-D-erythritol 4-phosphate cytidylyltransferase